MQAGELGARASIHSQDELGALARQFNRMAEQLEQSFAAIQQERDTLRRFVADASHELRTPMTALRTFTELLQGNAGQDATRRAEFLRESEAQLVRLEWITRNLLDLSRLDAGIAALELTRHDVGSLVDAALAPFHNQAQAAQTELVYNPAPDPIELVCDGARMEIALRNLIDNALKFTPPGGRIEVGFRAVQMTSEPTDKLEDVDDFAARASTLVRLWVQDTGPGIAPADRGQIFNRFYRGTDARQEGSGLGLAIVQSIVQAHGGRVTVNDLGKDVGDDSTTGSRFEITLPSLPPAPDAQPV
jgi:two-component system OmpR family sensor kinase